MPPRNCPLEAGLRFANVDDALLTINEPFDPNTGFATRDAFLDTDHQAGVTYVQPNAALVFDNSLFGYVGPFYGQRYRLEYGYTVGSWRYSQITADYRRYDRVLGPIVLASRLLYFGRIGRDAEQFRIYAGSNDMIRGNTSGSYRNNECRQPDPNTQTGCVELDRLVGTQIGVASVELRFPLLNPSFAPSAFPPLEGAVFYDVGMVWEGNSTIRWKRRAGDSPTGVRTPLKTVGFALRANLFGFAIGRLDYSIPQDRPQVGGIWTFSLGPTF